MLDILFSEGTIEDGDAISWYCSLYGDKKYEKVLKDMRLRICFSVISMDLSMIDPTKIE